MLYSLEIISLHKGLGREMNENKANGLKFEIWMEALLKANGYNMVSPR